MIDWVIAAPFAAAMITILFRDQDTRRYARIVLSGIAAVLPISLIGRVDGLSLLFTIIVSVLGLLATLYSTGTFSVDWGIGKAIWSRKSVYFLLVGAFWSTMLMVVLADNFATLWLGISATTLATAFLVGFSGEPTALEAAWKYLVLCSVGIGFALLGIVLLAHVSIVAGLDPANALSWVGIAGRAPTTAPPLARLATALMLIGFATKAGLVPMHAWLPDAHSKAPAPVSALLSGVLVSCALYAIMRTLAVGSELLVVLAGIAAHRWIPLLLGLVGISLAFAAISRTAIGIESGRKKVGSVADAIIPRPLSHRLRLATIATALALVGATSLSIVPWSALGAALQVTASAIGVAP